MQQTDLSRPVMALPTGRYAWAASAMAIDLLLSSSLFFSGHSVALAHVSGFAAACLSLLAFRLAGVDRSAVVVGAGAAGKTLRVLVFFFVHVAIRGGSIVTLANFGLSTPLAIAVGILVAALIGTCSSTLLMAPPRSSSRWFGLSISVLACSLALRLVFLGGVEITPQEAYYWNYAQHLSPGYLDHPPLVAVTIYLGEFLFGHNAWGTRFGALVYGVLFALILYRYARVQVDRNSAMLAAAIALLLPYFFLGSGFLATPDAPLAPAWAMALLFFYRALVNGEHRAWYGVGLAMGIGMLSKYTIALLAPAALLFMLLDSKARRYFLRKEPYFAVGIAALVFSPVIYWNLTNGWASFVFQARDRFEAAPHFFLDLMLVNILAVATPLPLLAVPYLFAAGSVRKGDSLHSPFAFRARLFIGAFLLLPLSVFAWNALENRPRVNWTGPLWISVLPMLAWLMVNADKIRWRWSAWLLKRGAVPLLYALLIVYAASLHLISLGLPGTPFPKNAARLVGWPEVSRNILAIREQLAEDVDRVVVVGMDKYFIASKLSYYGTPNFLGVEDGLRVTGRHLVGESSLMFAYWNQAKEFRGETAIMLARAKHDLSDERVGIYFDDLSPEIIAFPVYKDDFGLPKETIRDFYYRIGFGYRPRADLSVAQAPSGGFH